MVGTAQVAPLPTLHLQFERGVQDEVQDTSGNPPDRTDIRAAAASAANEELSDKSKKSQATDRCPSGAAPAAPGATGGPGGHDQAPAKKGS